MDSNSQEPTSNSGRQWLQAAALLSLDCTVPFLPLIGLDPRIAWKDCMRAFFREHRSLVFSGKPFETASLQSIISGFTDRILGISNTHKLIWWMAIVYSEGPQDHTALRSWTLVFRCARRTSENWVRLELPVRLRDEAKKQFNLSTNLDEWNQLILEKRAKRLSDWDLHMYALHQWNDDLPDTPNGPESMMYPVMRVWKALLFWDWLLSEISEHELARLRSAANGLVQAEPELKFIESLADPSLFRIEIP